MHAMRGEFDIGARRVPASRRMLEELGWTFLAALGSIVSGPVEMLAGDPVAAEAELRRDYEALDRLGDRNYISTVAGLPRRGALPAGAVRRVAHVRRVQRRRRGRRRPRDPGALARRLGQARRARRRARRGRARRARGGRADQRARTTRSTRPTRLMDLGEVLRMAGKHDDGDARRVRGARPLRAEGQPRVRGGSPGVPGRGCPAGSRRACRAPEMKQRGRRGPRCRSADRRAGPERITRELLRIHLRIAGGARITM